MTLILSLGNSDQFIQLSDRRLSRNGHPVDDEYNKAGILICKDARFIFGFTGIAKVETFRIHQWILRLLYESGPPDYTIYNMLERFKNKASEDFKSRALLKDLSSSDRKLSIIFSGYIYLHTPPLGGCAVISNYQDCVAGIDYSKALDNFQSFYTKECRPLKEAFTFVQRIGMGSAMHAPDEVLFRSFLKDKKPAKAIIGKSVELMRSMADRPEAHGVIGKQITAISLPCAIHISPETGYYTNTVTYCSYLPSQVISISDNKRCIIMDPSLEVKEPTGEPIAFVPKVPRNSPCPCKSGKKYKHCHGKR
jgi:hypothetical protein